MIEPNRIIFGKCDEVLKGFADNSFDSCVTDPPYGISFMNKHWDYDMPKVELWKEVFRVLKPGAHMLVACGTRTQHRMAVNIEDAGFEIRDVISWIYGSGFPKSLDVSKAIDKAAGAEREIGGYKPIAYPDSNCWSVPNKNSSNLGAFSGHIYGDGELERGFGKGKPVTAPSTEAAKDWEGWGTALKPATEFWTLARKPISENTVAQNVLKHGTGGINIDGSRIGEFINDNPSGLHRGSISDYSPKNADDFEPTIASVQGRFPANVILDEFTGKILDEQSGLSESKLTERGDLTDIRGNNYNNSEKRIENSSSLRGHNDFGGASRFFYCPKADGYERNKGLNGFELKPGGSTAKGYTLDVANGNDRNRPVRNHHPTVKPIDLMRYLVKLITPKRGITIDPFCGSGTTCIGAKLELINYVGIEMVEEYCKIAEVRIAAWNPPKYIEQKLF